MFRGNSYVDDPDFANFVKKPGHSNLRTDVSDINKTDKYGNSLGSPSHDTKKGLNKYTLQNSISPSQLNELQNKRDQESQQY